MSTNLDLLNDGLSYMDVGQRQWRNKKCGLRGIDLLHHALNNRRNRSGWRTVDLARQVSVPVSDMHVALLDGKKEGLVELRACDDRVKRWFWIGA